MDLRNAKLIIDNYSICPNCGSEYIGDGHGTIDIGDNSFSRTCKCGWEVTGYVEKEGNYMVIKNNYDNRQKKLLRTGSLC